MSPRLRKTRNPGLSEIHFYFHLIAHQGICLGALSALARIYARYSKYFVCFYNASSNSTLAREMEIENS